MPGIVGFVDLEGRVSKDRLSTMLDQVTHTKEYVIDSFEGSCFAIGRADLPTFNPDRQPYMTHNLAIFFQGNIVNKHDLFPHEVSPLTNMRVIAMLYSIHGAGLVDVVKGHFVAAIWDSQRQCFLLMNDRFGRHRMYLWSPGPGILFFGCEMKSIVSIARNNLRPNVRAILDFLQFEQLLGDETYFQNVSQLPCASILRFDGKGIRINRYWHPRSVSGSRWSDDEYAQRLHEKLAVAVKRAVDNGNRRIGVMLSGGLDSRIIAAHLPEPQMQIHAFTFGHPQDENVRLAQLVAHERRYAHHFIPKTSEVIPQFAEITMQILEAESTIMVGQNMLVFPEAKRSGVELLLGGDSGNRVFGVPLQAYSFPMFALLSIPYLGHLFLGIIRKSCPPKRCYSYVRNLLHGLDEDEVLSILDPRLVPTMRGVVGDSARMLARMASKNGNIFEIATFVSLTEYVRWLRNAQDSCRWKVEAVDPFLDYDLVDLVMEFPIDCRLWRRLPIKEMEMNHPALMHIVLQSRQVSKANLLTFARMLAARTPLIRRLAAGRPIGSINGFPDFIRQQEDFIQKTLLCERVGSRGLFNQAAIRAVIDDHMHNRKDHTRLISRLVSLELWFKFLEDSYGLNIFRFNDRCLV